MKLCPVQKEDEMALVVNTPKHISILELPSICSKKGLLDLFDEEEIIKYE